MPEMELVRLILTIQGLLAGDTEAATRLETLQLEMADLVIVEPVEDPLWQNHGTIISENLAGWVAELDPDDSVEAYLVINRLPLFLELPHDEFDAFLQSSRGFGPERVESALCIQTSDRAELYWLNEHYRDDRVWYSLWRSPGEGPRCEHRTVGGEAARHGYVAAIEEKIAYTEQVFSPDSFWISEYMRPQIEMIESDGHSGRLFDGLVDPGTSRALLEAAFGYVTGGGMGSWDDHFPPDHLLASQQAVLERNRNAYDAALLFAVNGGAGTQSRH